MKPQLRFTERERDRNKSTEREREKKKKMTAIHRMGDGQKEFLRSRHIILSRLTTSDWLVQRTAAALEGLQRLVCATSACLGSVYLE